MTDLNQITTEDFQSMMGETLGTQLNVATGLKIKNFTGFDPRSVISWLDDYEVSADCKGWKDEHKLKRIAFYLSDYAKEWFMMKMYKQTDPPKTFAEFRKAMEKHFLPDDYESY